MPERSEVISHTSREIHIRSMQPSDKGFILRLAPRFVAVGVPPWRDAARALGFHQETTVEVVTAQGSDTAVFVAEDAAGAPLGFIHMTGSGDFLTGEPQGYISAIAVTEEAEGSGVGKALMAAGEAWAREQGYRVLALDTFAMNTRGRAFYQRLGYLEETVKYVKVL